VVNRLRSLPLIALSDSPGGKGNQTENRQASDSRLGYGKDEVIHSPFRRENVNARQTGGEIRVERIGC